MKVCLDPVYFACSACMCLIREILIVATHVQFKLSFTKIKLFAQRSSSVMRDLSPKLVAECIAVLSRLRLGDAQWERHAVRLSVRLEAQESARECQCARERTPVACAHEHWARARRRGPASGRAFRL